VVGTIAVLRRQKRIDVLLDAVSGVLAEVPESSIVIIGDGPLRGQLERRARDLGLPAERFAFLPFRHPSARYLQALDVFVLPSSWEAFPVSILEALSCGVPQVATDVGGTREAVSEETAILVSPGSPDGLGDAVIRLLRDPERRAAMAQASTARHESLFGVERMIAETAAVYESLAGAQQERLPMDVRRSSPR
jgi:glycosyltransferase involved in cell wall biosynthesis